MRVPHLKSRISNLRSKIQNRKLLRGFTLVEMLVVIAIIGILAAILLPAVGSAIKAAKVSTIVTEIDELAKAIEQYKQKHGDYPPDFTDTAALTAHIRAAYPRNTRDVATWITSPPWPAPTAPKTGKQDPATLDAAEALVFWLSAVNKNPRDPLDIDLVAPDQANFDSINGAGDGDALFPFEETRLVDVDGDGWPEYVSQHSPDAPYVYFDGRVLSGAYHYGNAGARYPPASGPTPSNSVGLIRPYRTNTKIDSLDNGKTILNNAQNDTTWHEPGKFQIISCGLDDHFGTDVPGASPVSKRFPDPNYEVQDEDADNLMNFSGGKTVQDAIP